LVGAGVEVRGTGVALGAGDVAKRVIAGCAVKVGIIVNIGVGMMVGMSAAVVAVGCDSIVAVGVGGSGVPPQATITSASSRSGTTTLKALLRACMADLDGQVLQRRPISLLNLVRSAMPTACQQSYARGSALL
jgi:hypothetical protein